MKIITVNTEQKIKERGDEGRKPMFESILVHIIFKEKQKEIKQINECWYQSQVMAICPINTTHSVCIMLHFCMFSGLSNWYCVTNCSAIFWGRLFLTYEIIANFKRANDFERENRGFNE